MAYEIVSYRPNCDNQIAQLQRHHWGTNIERNAAYFRWKYRDNPFSNQPLVYLAFFGGRLVAMRGMFETLWQVDSEGCRHGLPYADDLVVAPEHRNQGVVGALMQFALNDLAKRGFAYTVSLSAGPITFISSLAAGWRCAGSFLPARLEMTPPTGTGHLRALARRMPLLRRVPMLRQIDRRLRERRSSRGFRSLDQVGGRRTGSVWLSQEPRPEAMAALVSRLPWDGRIRHVRSADYYAWRFRNPMHEYRFLFHEGDGLTGYLVLQRSTSDAGDPDHINIADWEGVDTRVRDELLRTALDEGHFSRVTAWTATAADSTQQLLVGHGFVPHSRATIKHRSEGMLVRRRGDDSGAPWTLGTRAVVDIGQWDLRMLYSMAA